MSADAPASILALAVKFLSPLRLGLSQRPRLKTAFSFSILAITSSPTSPLAPGFIPPMLGRRCASFRAALRCWERLSSPGPSPVSSRGACDSGSTRGRSGRREKKGVDVSCGRATAEARRSSRSRVARTWRQSSGLVPQLRVPYEVGVGGRASRAHLTRLCRGRERQQ